MIFHEILVVRSFESFSQGRWDQCMYFVNFFQNFIRWISCKTHLLSRHNFRNHMRNFVPSPCTKFFEFLMWSPLSRDSVLKFWYNFITSLLRTSTLSKNMAFWKYGMSQTLKSPFNSDKIFFLSVFQRDKKTDIFFILLFWINLFWNRLIYCRLSWDFKICVLRENFV